MILVTGLGAITSQGDFTLHSPAVPRASGLDLPDFDLKTYLASPKTYLDRTSALALAGAALALRDSGLEGPFDEEFGLAVGTLHGCVDTMRAFEAKLAESGPRAVSPLLFSHSYFNSPASLCAIEWGLKGYHATVCGPEAGVQALEMAAYAIELGHATRMLAGAAEAATVGRSLGEDRLGQGEGAIFVVLEDAAAAKRRGIGPVNGAIAWETILELTKAAESASNGHYGRCGALDGLLPLLSGQMTGVKPVKPLAA